jgi:membrane protease YdiL (CAAX protease family)
VIAAAIGRVFAFVILFAVLEFAAYGILAGPVTWLVARTGQRIRVDELLSLAAALGATGIMLRMVDHRPWRVVGLAPQAARPPIVARGWSIGFVAIGAACGALLALGWLRIVPADPGSSLGAAARITLFLLPAALAEEVLCRGYLLTVIRDAVGTWGAVAITSLAFALLHLTNPGWTVASVTVVGLAGVFLAVVRVAYDSLYAAWAAHVAWNWVMAVPLHAPVSGLRFESPDYRTVSAGPEWVTGGAWGPEGGIAAVVGMLACLSYLYARRRREES